MKQILFSYLVLITFTACNSKVSVQPEKDLIKSETRSENALTKIDTIEAQSASELKLDREASIALDFKKFHIYNLADSIKADFTGDDIEDLAFFTSNNNGEIFIVDGNSKNKSKIGLDKSFIGMGERFDWVDFWGTTDDQETTEIIFKDDEIVDEQKTKLNHTSIFLRKDEVGGGVITYKDGKYIWIHQSD